ncbi:hypothetical protein JMM81_06615 [Bacillus sp. V3B]|uniref:hypothetical protein n=1 Tax=Bacillus sp. V3B TaxID=2804915 RepID=UPI00210C3AEA|nr:hypothetical protein [Bacillus sp. V3B]MCQ6274646.1 hypothetical protein [Bacillus sp. V3B]
MKRKWFLMLASLFLSTTIVAGCNAEGDPAPPVDEDIRVKDPFQKADEIEEDGEQRSEAEENRDEEMEEDFEETVEDLEHE